MLQMFTGDKDMPKKKEEGNRIMIYKFNNKGRQ